MPEPSVSRASKQAFNFSSLWRLKNARATAFARGFCLFRSQAWIAVSCTSLVASLRLCSLIVIGGFWASLSFSLTLGCVTNLHADAAVRGRRPAIGERFCGRGTVAYVNVMYVFPKR